MDYNGVSHLASSRVPEKPLLVSQFRHIYPQPTSTTTRKHGLLAHSSKVKSRHGLGADLMFALCHI